MSSPTTYESTYRIRYTESDPSLRLSPVCLFNLLQETAIRASTSVGRGPQALLARGLGWFLLRFRLVVEEMPTLDQQITIRTWSSGIEKILASREFEILSEDAAILARATTRWVVMDLSRRRPVRVPTWVSDPYSSNPHRLLADQPLEDWGDHTTGINASAIGQRDFAIRHDDLDSNQHAGSATYVAACLESLPPELSAKGTLLRLGIDFKQEGRLGDSLCLETSAGSAETGTLAFSHRIARQDSTLALGASVWRPSAISPIAKTVADQPPTDKAPAHWRRQS
jgi:acyl-ACP thioesterase